MNTTTLNVNYALTEARLNDEITLEEYTAAQDITFIINDEDIPLFIQSIRAMLRLETFRKYDAVEAYLRNISRVEYSHESDNIYDVYDGAYVVTFKDGSSEKLGWKDFDSMAKLYPIK